jgi:glutamate--cysteine ligase catalytic subunit
MAQVKGTDEQVDENMQRAQTKDASKLSSFYFRRQVFPNDRPQTRYDIGSRPVSPPASATASHRTSPPASPVDRLHHLNGNGNGHGTPPRSRSAQSTRCSSPQEEEEQGPEVMEMTMDEVINGRGDGAFPGLMGVVNAYLNSLNVDVATKCDLRRYLDLIKWRARGESSSFFFLFREVGDRADVQVNS